MDHEEPGSPPVTPTKFIEPSFEVPAWAWSKFVSTRPNSVYLKRVCKHNAKRGDPEALAQWNDWLFYVAERRVRGEL